MMPPSHSVPPLELCLAQSDSLLASFSPALFLAIFFPMARSRSFEPLARRLCKAVFTLIGPSQWISVASVAKEINVADEELVQGAIQHGEREGWLMSGGKPVHSVLLTHAGEQIAEKIQWQPTTAHGTSKNVVRPAGKKVRTKTK